MKKLTSSILAILLALCVALPVQAVSKDDATSLQSLEGIWQLGGEEGTTWLEFDGKGR